MNDRHEFDFWYAVNNTEVVIRPRQQLETFGTTTLHYHLVSELMDSVDRVRVREGKIHAYRPQILTPDALAGTLLEGFGEEEAGRYIEWLRRNQQNLVLLQYGFSIRKEAVSDEIITDSIENVIDRVRLDMEEKQRPMHSLIRGVEEPWEVCLLTLLVDVVQQSVVANAKELKADPDGSRHEIDTLFREASRNPSLIPRVSEHLHRAGLFKQYEDRFFALVKAASGR